MARRIVLLLSTAIFLLIPQMYASAQSVALTPYLDLGSIPKDSAQSVDTDAGTANAVTPPETAEPFRPFELSVSPKRPAALLPLYAGFVALQGYDTYSTLSAIRKGAVEVNPLMTGVTKQPALFVAVKGATTFGSIYAAERLWRKNRKAAAITTIVVANAMVAVVAARNASVLRTLR